MQLEDFDYDFPFERIAQYPVSPRDSSRLLVVSDHFHDSHTRRLADYLQPGDLLVFNDSRTIPARLYGRKSSGGKVEILIERLLGDGRARAMLRANRPPAPDSTIRLAGNGSTLRIERKAGGLYVLHFASEQELLVVLERYGAVPLPPYIKRPPEDCDRQSYQTIFARNPGSVATPTAGLHFTTDLLASLRREGIDMTWITLHVGSATFQPLQGNNIDDHRLHSEWYSLSAENADKIRQTRSRKGRVVAVGTTVVRTLESAWVTCRGDLKEVQGDTSLFIKPGYRFHLTDMLLTNFHLPKSTLLMLVCAFCGYDKAMAAYYHALQRRYRLFSYGDAMLVGRYSE